MVRAQKRVSLVELLIVIVILSLLATTITLSVSGVFDDAETGADQLRRATWNAAADRYMWQVQQGVYPSSFQAMIDAKLVDSDADSTGLVISVPGESIYFP